MSLAILVINPGSTSTKFAVFEGGTRILDQSISHSAEEIARFPSIAAQYEFREKAIQDVLLQKSFDTQKLGAVVGRGGLLHPIPGGVYRINEGMKADLLAAKYGEHASNLGALIADAFARPLGIPAGAALSMSTRRSMAKGLSRPNVPARSPQATLPSSAFRAGTPSRKCSR